MKIILTIALCAVAVFGLFQLFPTEEEFEIYESTVRLHVIANSDSEKDQALKLQVRDAILETMIDFDSPNKEIALKNIQENKDKLIEIATTVIRNNGENYKVEIEIGNELYPTKYYEDFALPAGEYTSVRIIIGDGQGQNWWCVLYPPLCNAGVEESPEILAGYGINEKEIEKLKSEMQNDGLRIFGTNIRLKFLDYFR